MTERRWWPLAAAAIAVGIPLAARAVPPPLPRHAPADAAPAEPDAAPPETVDSSPPPPEIDEEVAVEQARPEELLLGGETIEITGPPPPPGAHTVIGERDLERSEHDDVHAVLRQVAGVYVRGEDGYGLRPNIGIRGAAAERSAKVALMEDGVLVAPAPYSAPAAYYFPLVTRMAGLEVVKGPSSVRYGPNTVGGAVNLIGAPMPNQRSAYVDLAAGSDLYGKLHARAAERWRHVGVMGEVVKLHTDGFKDIDGGGDSGFDKNDAQGWLRAHSAFTDRVYHQVDLKVGYGDEVSRETYTGLTDDDFAAAPQRRYAGTQLDEMSWDHWRFRLVHRVEVGSDLSVETTAYRHTLDRAWGKVDGFVGERDLAGVLASPMTGSNAVYYALISGQANSSSPEEELVLGTNDRSFVSQGTQSRLEARGELGPTEHRLEVGVRLHQDRALRRRYEDTYLMVDGELARSERPRSTVLDTTAETLALATYAQDRASWKRVTVTGGARLELIASDFQDHLGDMVHEEVYPVLIPGGGIEYRVLDRLSLLGGVHRGFVPVAPSGDDGVRPESSVNLEAGARWSSERLAAEAIGFFSDYSNLKGSCTLSTGCGAEQDGDEFNGGRVQVWGAEAQAASELPLPRGFRLPAQATYTLTSSSFQSSFESDFASWGDVEIGDELPYLPRHRLALSAGLGRDRWEVTTAASWQSAARDVAGAGAIPDLERIDPLLLLGAAAHVRLDWAELYSTVENLLDEQAILSRRPYGARPNAPRRIVVGVKARF
jgi:Fe(3+) dicitrate transport protein